MNKVVWKYSVEPSPRGPSYLFVPRNTDMLSTVQCQNGIPQVYFLVDPDETEHEEVAVWCIGTGWDDINESFCGAYVGTTQSKQGYVWHVFVE